MALYRRQQFGEELVLATSEIELAAERDAGAILLHQVQGHMAQNCEIVGAVIVTISRLVFIHHCIENPVGGLVRHPRRRIAHARHLVYGSQPGPSTTPLQSFHLGRNQTGASFDAAMIVVHGRTLVDGFVSRLREQEANIGMQRAMIPFERQDIVATPFDDLSDNFALAIERWQLSASALTIVPLSERPKLTYS
jgi:hypothetical protein